VLLAQAVEGAGELGGVGAAEDDGGAELEGCFGDAETYAGGSAEDEDAAGVELRGV